MKIARVFPSKTNLCPIDQNVYFDSPDMFTPKYEEVHISCTFTWDRKRAEDLASDWGKVCNNVKIGGVAIDGESDQPFQSGMYLKTGVTITSRGCCNNCSFCMVRKQLTEFDIFPEGHIINDNNILATSNRHWNLVMKMLRNQSKIEFLGGLESSRVTPQIAEDLRSLKIESLWLACDSDADLKPLKKAVDILNKAGFTRRYIRCYVLTGKEEMRIREVFNIGCLPFAQLYLPPTDEKYQYTKQAKAWQREWCRPALYKITITKLR